MPTTAITTQPVSQTVCAGTDVTFSISANGAGLNYQWYQWDGSNSNALGTGTSLTISGASGPGSPTPPFTFHYYCVVAGTCGSVQSNTIDLNVLALPPPPSVGPFGSTATNIWVQLGNSDGNCMSYRYSNDGGNTWSIWQDDKDANGSCYTLNWPYAGPLGYPSGSIVVQAREINSSGCYSPTTTGSYTF
jgi:hypothetical protein